MAGQVICDSFERAKGGEREREDERRWGEEGGEKDGEERGEGVHQNSPYNLELTA